MASQTFSKYEAEIDASLAIMTPVSSHPDEIDMAPLHVCQFKFQDDSEITSSDSSSPPRKSSLPRSRAKKVRKAAHQTQQTKPLLRPAKDVLSRIRHDSALDESDFIVGYLDRHCPDVMEMEVSSWKGGGDVTDEEWIPQHRIMYFRKKNDEAGRKVWDRAARLDRLFGSGVVAEEQVSKATGSRREGQCVTDTQERGLTDQRMGNASNNLVLAFDASNEVQESSSAG